MNWEEVFRTENEMLSRLPVDGGWLYRYEQRQGSEHGGYRWFPSICFVPEPAPPP